jgi:hypothetical protein
MLRKLTADAQAIEARLFASLGPGEHMPIIETLVIPAGEIVQFNAEEDEPGSVRITWRGKAWVIDKANWDLGRRVERLESGAHDLAQC